VALQIKPNDLEPLSQPDTIGIQVVLSTEIISVEAQYGTHERPSDERYKPVYAHVALQLWANVFSAIEEHNVTHERVFKDLNRPSPHDGVQSEPFVNWLIDAQLVTHLSIAINSPMTQELTQDVPLDDLY